MANKEIMLPSEVKKGLEKDFGVSGVTVWKALNFETSQGKANLIRKAALERGGRIYDGSPSSESWAPDCETTHQTADQTMTQVFSDRVKIIADFKNGKVAVYVDEDIKVSGSLIGMSIHEFMNLQKHASDAAYQLEYKNHVL